MIRLQRIMYSVVSRVAHLHRMPKCFSTLYCFVILFIFLFSFVELYISSAHYLHSLPLSAIVTSIGFICYAKAPIKFIKTKTSRLNSMRYAVVIRHVRILYYTHARVQAYTEYSMDWPKTTSHPSGSEIYNWICGKNPYSHVGYRMKTRSAQNKFICFNLSFRHTNAA